MRVFPTALLTVLLLSSLLGAMPSQAQTPATTGGNEYLNQVRRDLGRLERQVINVRAYEGGPAGQPLPGADGQPIRPRELYTVYLQKADTLSSRLIDLGARLHPKQQTAGSGLPQISLQQLGAQTQRLSAENLRFRDSFKYGEDQLESYKLIQTAVTNLEDAVVYWRLANRYRATYRGLASERLEDDEILRTKLQAAIQAIDRLETIEKMRTALDALNEDAYP